MRMRMPTLHHLPLAGKETARNHDFMDFLIPSWERTYPIFNGTCEDDDDFPFSSGGRCYVSFMEGNCCYEQSLNIPRSAQASSPCFEPLADLYFQDPNPKPQQLKHSAVIFDIGTSFLLGWPVFLCRCP